MVQLTDNDIHVGAAVSSKSVVLYIFIPWADPEVGGEGS